MTPTFRFPREVAFSRRLVLKAALVGGAVLVTAGLPDTAEAADGGFAPPRPDGASPRRPLAWVSFRPDDTLVIRCARAEMGQGVTTALPQILADEMEADWSRVRFEFAPLDDAFNDPRQKERDTGGSRSVRMSWPVLRDLGAALREMLVSAAAARLHVPADELVARNGEVVHSATGRRLSYGALAPDLPGLPVPEKPRLKDPDEFRLIGRSLPRLDLEAKVDGSARYTIDIRLPDMLTATVAQCPVFGGRVRSVDETSARTVPGVREIAVFDTWVGVVADDFWTAKKGLDALAITWDEGPHGELTSEALAQRLARFADEGRPLVARSEGDAPTALTRAPRRVEATYEVPYLAHTPMEPMGAVARVTSDRCELWVGTQRPTVTQQFCAHLLGLPPAAVVLHDQLIGGGFGRRFEIDFVEQAVQLARRVPGRPVKVTWTREEEVQHGFFRPATYNRLSAGLDDSGAPVAWTHRIAAQALLERLRPYAMRNGIDPSAVEGAANHPYAVPNMLVDYVKVEAPVPVGAWRSVGSSQNAFVTESFVDELAHVAGVDPLAYRLRHLGNHPRHRAALETVAREANWAAPLPPGWSRGIAVAEAFAGWSAQVVEIERLAGGRIAVRRIVAVIDCGRVVNPDLVRAQLEGAVIWGLSAALTGEVRIEGGRVAQSNFHDMPILRFDEAPRIETHIIASDAPPGGVGEVGTPPVAPALANAVFAATGRRIRSLPLSRHGLV
jgi:isoquinoline 1-oxidoreductase subunit beta